MAKVQQDQTPPEEGDVVENQEKAQQGAGSRELEVRKNPVNMP